MNLLFSQNLRHNIISRLPNVEQRLIPLLLLLFLGTCIAFLPLGLVKLKLLPRIQSAGNLPYYDCTYSGNVTFQGIDVPFGRLTFAQSKAIDLAWNTIVGRGLQVLLSLLSYRSLMNTLMVLTESDGVTYNLYAVLAFSPTTLHSLWHLFKAFMSKHSPRAKLRIAWLLISVAYLLAFPTLIDAVTGYQAVQSTVLNLEYDQSLDLSQGLSAAFYNYLITSGVQDVDTASPLLKPNLRKLPTSDDLGFTWDPDLQGYFSANPTESGITFEGYIVRNSSNTAAGFLFGAIPVCVNDTFSELYLASYTAQGKMVIDPNATLTYSDPSCESLNDLLQDWQYNPQEVDLSQNWNYDLLMNRENYQCVTQTDIYQWGFSYAFLLAATIINAIWFLGTALIYLDAELHSELVGKARIAGTWRAVLDLAEAVKEYIGPDTCAYAEDEIVSELDGNEIIAYRVKEHKDSTASIFLGRVDDGDMKERFELNYETVYRG